MSLFRAIQIKTTVDYHLSAVRRAIIRNTKIGSGKDRMQSLHTVGGNVN